MFRQLPKVIQTTLIEQTASILIDAGFSGGKEQLERYLNDSITTMDHIIFVTQNLEKAGLNRYENYVHLFKHHKTNRFIEQGLRHLIAAKILTQPNFDALIKYRKCPYLILEKLDTTTTLTQAAFDNIIKDINVLFDAKKAAKAFLIGIHQASKAMKIQDEKALTETPKEKSMLSSFVENPMYEPRLLEDIINFLPKPKR